MADEGKSNDTEIQFKLDIIQRLTRIEESTRSLEELSKQIGRTDDLAGKALIMSQENKEDISEIKENNKWLWRTVAVTVFGMVLKYLWPMI
ncbi:hemolysin XhlA family protein [Bavariicoccus seileri]|uniref:hemolysin XhlA family protein n=1 Tax=Bavariicoccus seileri TaxID=549685 RepID=UPI0003B53FF4|nr:hemolysin XhlA family protein [Bavariicoccus seileri]